MIPSISRYITLCIALLATMALSGCGGSDGDNGADAVDTGGISVTVQDANGNEIADATVTTSPSVTDMNSVPIGVYEVTASADGYTDGSETVGVVAGSTAEVTITLSTATTSSASLTGPYSGDEIESCSTCHAADREFGVSNYHGADVVAAEENLVGNRIKITIDSVSADATGVQTVSFHAEDLDGNAFTTLTSVSAALAKLESDGNWVPYFYTTESPNDWAASHDSPDPVVNGAELTDVVMQASRDSGTLDTTDAANGNYVYTFADQDLTDNATPANHDGSGGIAASTTIGYDDTLTHRVSLMTGGHSGPTDQTWFDFIPSGAADGSDVTDTRNIISTTACQQCHGDEFHGHGGDRLVLEGCVTCHNPSTFDSGSGAAGEKETMDAKVLFHRIHMGSSLPTTYQLSHRGSVKDWSEVGFPADVRNCEKCHYEPTGETLDDVTAWQTPNITACGSCHSDIDFSLGESGGHAGGIVDESTDCTVCHKDGGQAGTVAAAHAIDREYAYDVAVTMSAPAGGTYYEAGETPLVTIVLSDPDTGNTIDHTTLTEDMFDGAGHPGLYLFVSGPRGDRKPVLTTAAEENSGHYASNPLYLHTDSSEDDPNVTVTSDKITYQLDAIPDDMEAGTYVAYVHAGLENGAGEVGEGLTHSTALTTFQVGTVTEEPKIADGCNGCHGLPDEVEADASSLGVDNVMHGSRPFDVDYCGSCHDYQTSEDGEGWAENRNGFGAAPIARRVHRVHSGASADGGRDWSHVGFPQNVLNCETCHGEGTSGAHEDNPNRLACTGCHESEDATTHTNLQTYDPTP